MEKLVSVLICAYNTEKYIKECLDSVINQTYKNLEIIVVNDGSTDNTASIIEDLQLKDERIKIIDNEKNTGFVNSLNKGLEYVTGEYIARTDSDDIVKPHWIETLVNRLEKDPKLIAIGAYLTVLSGHNNGSKLSKYYKDQDIWKNPLSHEEIVEAMPFYNPMHNNCMIMRSTIYKKYGLKFDNNYKHAEDYKFWLEVSRIGKLENYPEALVYYRLHQEQTSSKYNEIQMNIARKVRKEAINYYLQDLNINGRLEDKLFFKDINHISDSLYNKKIKSKTLENIMYDCYFSLDRYNKKDILNLIINYKKLNLPLKKFIKLIKKFIRPYKYDNRL
ncbi:glycosyltransferase family 2 protein [Avibacterium avium]|uniref:glycosyltransferase family 2 protein n=1 Tax=Avibacterium avium TaxID=751 RepID=UPI003BF8F15D